MLEVTLLPSETLRNIKPGTVTPAVLASSLEAIYVQVIPSFPKKLLLEYEVPTVQLEKSSWPCPNPI